MDKDQEMYRNAESGELVLQPEASDDPYKQPNEHKHFMTLLFYLEDALMKSPIPAMRPTKRLVDVEAYMKIINNIRGNLPLAIQYANELVLDRAIILSDAHETAAIRTESATANAKSIMDTANDEAGQILYDANEKAEKIINDAQIRASSLVSQSAITISAQNEARNIVAEARVKASDIERDAKEYSEKLLGNIEREFLSVVDKVRDMRSRLDDIDTDDRV